MSRRNPSCPCESYGSQPGHRGIEEVRPRPCILPLGSGGSQETWRRFSAGLTNTQVAAYSIVARDPETGEMGVAVQSHWFSVGPIVPWAEAGVGAVATQSLVDPAYGPLGLELMRRGRTAPPSAAVTAGRR